MPTIYLEGQAIPLTEEQCATDEILINTLLPFYPDAARAEIKRETTETGEVKITMVKGTGTKGNCVAALKASPHRLNPALVMSWQLKNLELQGQLSVETLIALQPQIEKAITVGESECEATQHSLKTLIAATPTVAKQPITGF